MSDLDPAELRLREAIEHRHDLRDFRAARCTMLLRMLLHSALARGRPGEWRRYPGTDRLYRISPPADADAAERAIKLVLEIAQEAAEAIRLVQLDDPDPLAALARRFDALPIGERGPERGQEAHGSAEPSGTAPR